MYFADEIACTFTISGLAFTISGLAIFVVDNFPDKIKYRVFFSLVPPLKVPSTKKLI